MRAGGSAEPWDTLANAPIFNSCSFSVNGLPARRLTRHLRRADRESWASACCRLVDERAVKFWLSPMITPSAKPASIAAWSAVDRAASTKDLTLRSCGRCDTCRGRNREEGAFGHGPGTARRILRDVGNARTSSRMPRGLAKRTAVQPHSARLERRVCFSCPGNDKQSLAARPAGAWSKTASLAAALYSPLASTNAATALTASSEVSSSGCVWLRLFRFGYRRQARQAGRSRLRQGSEREFRFMTLFFHPMGEEGHFGEAMTITRGERKR